MLAEKAGVKVGVEEELPPPKRPEMTEDDWCSGFEEEEEAAKLPPAFRLDLKMLANLLGIFSVKLGTRGSCLG